MRRVKKDGTKRINFAMEETVHTTSLDDGPIWHSDVCGYSKVGLPEADHPCPEVGGVQAFFLLRLDSGWIGDLDFVCSFCGWCGFLVELHVLTRNLFFGPWLFICTTRHVVSDLHRDQHGEKKREPRRKSVRNIGFALVSRSLRLLSLGECGPFEGVGLEAFKGPSQSASCFLFVTWVISTRILCRCSGALATIFV